jgi:hypothetical protein
VAANGLNFKFMEKVIAPAKELSAAAYFLLRKLKACIHQVFGLLFRALQTAKLSGYLRI